MSGWVRRNAERQCRLSHHACCVGDGEGRVGYGTATYGPSGLVLVYPMPGLIRNRFGCGLNRGKPTSPKPSYPRASLSSHVESTREDGVSPWGGGERRDAACVGRCMCGWGGGTRFGGSATSVHYYSMVTREG
eukprot:3993348-Prymnesium_polylepis.1